jgi:hypothetical protein
MTWFDTRRSPAYVAGSMRRSAIVLGLSALLIIPASAWSQDPPPEGTEETEEIEGEEKGDETQVQPERSDAIRSDSPTSIAGIDAASVPNDQKQTRVEGMLAEERKILARVTELLKEARAAKDIVQLNCINEKLTQIKGLLKISEDASVKMYEGISANQQDIVNHEYTKINVAHQRSVTLGAEAEQCVGEIAIYTGQTEVTVEIDEDITEDDPTQPPPVGPAPVIPPFASPQ